MDSSMLNKMVLIKGGDDELFDGEKLKSEYELNKFVVEFLKETNQPCEFCNSYNLDILDIEYDGIKAYDRSETFFNQIEVIIKKRGDGQDSVDIEKGFDEDFMRKVIDTVINEVKYISNSLFEEKSKGHIRFIVSRKRGEVKDVFRIERFNFAGYTKDQILNLLKLIKENLNSFR